ncbi:protein kinase-like domain-containingprotein [Penicillium cataractarum]|uniref:Protein kinase-like domain-containingprotein n=1 Tax=Penicillium cataractarum TaxID=2100454 RepID=A0A9W9REH3_9EURO|nr:protein kinase-like domain-containingprotein [Penicillium cataractarum]KAJ5358773.1 protein kinase-like domain-containingprotein [Penicillium cataractarum]
MAAPSPVYRPPYDGSPFHDLGVTDDMILHVAAICRSHRFTPTLIRDAGFVPFFGFQYAYWPIQYEDGVRVFVKIPLMTFSTAENNQLVYTIMEKEHENLLFLQNRGFQWSPRMLYHTMETNNPLGHPYMIETMLPGKRLEWSDTSPVDKVNREKVLKQVAQVIFDLALLKPKQTDLGNTPWKCLQAAMDNRTREAIRGMDRGLGFTITGCFVLQILARRLLAGKTNMDFVLSHEALQSHNIFVDDDFNVTGFIEWGLVRPLPVRFAFRFPAFLHIMNKQQPASMPSDQHAYTREFLKVPALMKAERECFIAHMQYEYATRASPSAIGHLSPKGWEMMCWDLENVDWSHMILDAVRSSRMQQTVEEQRFLVACLPDFKGNGIHDVVKKEDIWDEAWAFFCRNFHFVHPWANGERTCNLLRMAVRARYPWEFVEIMLVDAFGPTPTFVDHRLNLR